MSSLRFPATGLALVLSVSAFAAPTTETFTEGSRRFVLEKGTIIVAENRNDPGSRTLLLPYQRLRALTTEPPRPPLFLLNGGPGSSNLSFGIVPKPVWGTRDLVSVGYRGVDGETLLPDNEFTKAFWDQGPDQSEADLRRVAAAYSAFVALCRSQNIDIDGYTVDEVVADVDALREALGYDQIDLYGVSYGTRLAYLHGRDFAATTHRMVLVAANPPGHFALAPSDYDALADQYSSVYGRDVLAEFRRVTTQMPDRWLWWGIDKGMVRLGAPQLMANPDTVDALVGAYGKASRGDFSGLVALSLMAPMMTTGIHVGELMFKGFVDFQPGWDYLSETADHGQYGRSFLRGTFGMAQFIPPSDLPRYAPSPAQVIEAPTLVLNGTHDSQTPLRGVKADMMPLLAQGTLVELEGYGHFNAVTSQPEAVGRVVVRFLDTGDVEQGVIPRGTLPGRFSLDLSAVGWGLTGASVAVVGVVGALVGMLWR